MANTFKSDTKTNVVTDAVSSTNTNGVFNIRDTTNSVDRLVVNTDGHVDVAGNLDVGAGLDVTGDISVTGTVDGKDIATLATESFATAIAVALG